MKYFIILASCLLNILVCQSLLERFIVPIYIESEISTGYNNNYLKLSSIEKDDNDLYNILGDSKQISSNIIKNKISILYIPYIFRHHETRFNFKISDLNYMSSELKSYQSYYFKFSQHLAPYTWVKFSYSYIPSFYIKGYRDSDPYISFEFISSYFPSIFTSEKIGGELTSPLPYSHRTYFSIRYFFENQFYNPEFIEYDLKIKNFYLKIRKKLFKHLDFSIAQTISIADNISYMNGLLSTHDRNRSYNQYKTSISISKSKFLFLGAQTSTGIFSSIEYRKFSSKIIIDEYHYDRAHINITTSMWIKRSFSDNTFIKLKGLYNQRNTSSFSSSVRDSKSFNKFEIWLSFILKLDLNVYH